MLRRLLYLLSERGMADINELASLLEVSATQVRGIIIELDRQGYLKQLTSGCEQPCERCPLHAVCLYRTRARVWTLTRMGERYAVDRISVGKGCED